MKNTEDNKLVEMACAGDTRAFESLVERHYETIFRMAFKWCGNRSDAEDITQNACIKLATAIHSFQFKSAFTSWLYRLVINTAIDLQRKSKRHQGVSGDIEQSAVSADAEDKLYALEILEQVDALPDKEKTALLLVMAEGMTHAEAAIVLECKESTVSWYIHEARKKLTAQNKKERHHG